MPRLSDGKLDQPCILCSCRPLMVIALRVTMSTSCAVAAVVVIVAAAMVWMWNVDGGDGSVRRPSFVIPSFVVSRQNKTFCPSSIPESRDTYGGLSKYVLLLRVVDDGRLIFPVRHQYDPVSV